MNLRTICMPASLALLVAVAPLAAAAQAEPERPEPWRTLHTNLLQVQKSVASVDRMIKRSMADVGGASGANWLETCCQYNIDKVRAGVGELRKGLDWLEAQYAKRSDLEAIKPLPVLREHLDTIETGFLYVGRAQNAQEAKARIDALIHPLSHVRQGLGDLEACCAVDAPAQ